MLRSLPLVLVLLAGSLAGQDGVIPVVDARSRFLGGTGLVAEGLEALWTNPAGFGALEVGQVGAGAGAEQRWGLAELRTLNAGAVYGSGFGGFGLQLATFGFDAYRETRVGLGYGRQLTEGLRIGAGFYGLSATTTGYAGTFDVTFSLGAQLRIVEDLAVGVHLFSPWRTGRLAEEYLPQVLSLGLAYAPTDQLLINVEAHQDTEYPMRFRMGLAYAPVEALRIRVGVVTGGSELTFGLGYVVLPGVEVTGGVGWAEVLGVSPGFGVRWGVE